LVVLVDARACAHTHSTLTREIKITNSQSRLITHSRKYY
jgi:hypothetical protein